MENSIAVADKTFNIVAHKDLWAHMNTVSKTLIESRALPGYLTNPAQVMVILETGQEMGFKFMESIKYLYIVNGAITLQGQGAIRRLVEAGYQVKYEEKDDECTAKVFTGGIEVARETVTFSDAEKSGYVYKSGGTELKPGWLPGLNRKIKLRYQAVSIIVKTRLPDVLGAALDIKEVAEDYEIIKPAEPVVTEIPEDRPTVSEFIKKAKEVKNPKPIMQVIQPTGLKATESESSHILPNVNNSDSLKKTPEELAEDERLVTKRKEVFATAKELGVEPEVVKEEIKKYYDNKKSFNDLNYLELSAYVRGMKIKLREKREKEVVDGK
jgi:hypothetical protein